MLRNWFAKRREEKQAIAFAKASERAVQRLGELIEKYPTAIMDETWLPLSKPQMKMCLKMAIATTRDQQWREHLKIGWMMLSNFQPNVGPVPIDLKLAPTAPTTLEGIKSAAEKLEPYLAISPTVQAEMQQNMQEARDFIASLPT